MKWIFQRPYYDCTVVIFETPSERLFQIRKIFFFGRQKIKIARLELIKKNLFLPGDHDNPARADRREGGGEHQRVRGGRNHSDQRGRSQEGDHYPAILFQVPSRRAILKLINYL